MPRTTQSGQISIRLHPLLIEQLRDLAEANGVSFNYQVRRLLADAMRRTENGL